MNRKEELLQKVSDLFAKQGYKKTSIRDIAAYLGMTNAGLYYFNNAAENARKGGSIIVSTNPASLPFVGLERGDSCSTCIRLSVTACPVSSPKSPRRSQETLDALREVVGKLGGCFSVSRSTVDKAAFHIYLPKLLADGEVSEVEHRIRQEPHLQWAMPGS